MPPFQRGKNCLQRWGQPFSTCISVSVYVRTDPGCAASTAGRPAERSHEPVSLLFVHSSGTASPSPSHGRHFRLSGCPWGSSSIPSSYTHTGPGVLNALEARATICHFALQFATHKKEGLSAQCESASPAAPPRSRKTPNELEREERRERKKNMSFFTCTPL